MFNVKHPKLHIILLHIKICHKGHQETTKGVTLYRTIGVIRTNIYFELPYMILLFNPDTQLIHDNANYRVEVIGQSRVLDITPQSAFWHHFLWLWASWHSFIFLIYSQNYSFTNSCSVWPWISLKVLSHLYFFWNIILNICVEFLRPLLLSGQLL